MSTGSCKICSSAYAKQFNKRLNRGDSLMKVVDWSATVDFPVSKPTVLNHKRHITDPKTTVVDQARKNPVIKRVSHEEFLQSLVDIAAARAAANPDDVSIDQGIRAASTLANKTDKQTSVLLVLAQRLMPKALPAEGEYEGEWLELQGDA